MITIRQGDLTDPIWKDTQQVIVHNVNSQGAMGSGVALALMKKWPAVRSRYIQWSQQHDGTFQLGNAQFVRVAPNIEVVNLIGQKNMGALNFSNLNVSLQPVRYEALYEGFLRVRSALKNRFKEGYKWNEHTIHAPLLAHGLSGGDFRRVFKEYVRAFEGTNSRTCFYAYSGKDYEFLKEVYKAECPSGMIDNELSF